MLIATGTNESAASSQVCSCCGESKPLTTEFFIRAKTCISGFRFRCRVCNAADHRERYQRDPDAYKARAKQYDALNSEIVQAHKAAKYAANRDQERRKRHDYYHNQGGRVAKREWTRGRRKNDPKFRIRELLGARFRQFVKRKPQGGFQAIVGYKVGQLYAHLERQFLPGMSWDNYGTAWEIDHILPVKMFDLPREAAQCWALTNLRPLWAPDNRRKSANRTHLL